MHQGGRECEAGDGGGVGGDQPGGALLHQEEAGDGQEVSGESTFYGQVRSISELNGCDCDCF